MFENHIVVFFSSQVSDDGDDFAPVITFGFAKPEGHETEAETANRFVREKQRAANSESRRSSYTLKLLAYTGPTDTTFLENHEAAEFFHQEAKMVS